MTEQLARLRAFIAAHPDVSVFAPGAPADAIANAEVEIGVPIPGDYKAFLAQFDGGFISLCGGKSDVGWEEEEARHGSIWLFGLERLVEEFHEQENQWDRDWEGCAWAHVPFCLVAGHELLMFAPPGTPRAGAVLDAWHESSPNDWGVLQPRFGDFLDALIAGGGRADVIARAK